MTDRDANRQLDDPRATVRPTCIPAVYLPGGTLWTWVSRAFGKLSARDLLALNAAANSPFATATPTPTTPVTENPGNKPEPPRPTPTNLNYTQAWNPVHAKNRKNQEQSITGKDPWKPGVSEIEFILVHELSRKFPEAYAYVIQRICERTGVPVPDTIQPPAQPKET